MFLLNSEVLEKNNHSTIAKVLDKSFSVLWPQGIIHDNVLLFLSDAAPYMVKAATSIQTYYSKMIHVTCLAHALHRVAEEIRIHFPNVDELINNVKKVFLKAPSRIQIFKTMASDIPLLPQPVLTRWGTWLNASMYYCDHFELIKEIINQLDGEDAVAVSKAQNLFSNVNLKHNLIYIKTNFSTLATSITQLETSGVPLIDSINIIQKIKAEIQKAPNQIGKIIVSPGQSACSYYYYVNEICRVPGVELSEIPDKCTSIFVNEVYVDFNNDVICQCKYNQNILDKVLAFSKPVYLYYSYANQLEWIQVLACEASDGGTNSSDEMKGLEAFLNEHPGITGVILTEFENNLMKSSFPNLEVGIQFEGRFLIDQYTNPQISWLDIAVIEPVTDFFIISVFLLNDCNDKSLYNSGVTPMTSSNTKYTMEKIKSILPELSIPKGKLYFKYRLNPTSDPNDSLTFCDLTIQQMCEYPANTATYCSDSMKSFYEKGQFASEHGAGFITDNINLNDPKNKCKCEKPFGSFYALLNGFEGGIAKPCELFPCRK
ncbi:hypothetical protein QTP88_006605 [Uroleucon formosanum]